MTTDERNLQVRIRAEYEEMPGLKLTISQASRLFNVEPTRCAQALDALVARGQLRTDGKSFLHSRAGRQRI